MNIELVSVIITTYRATERLPQAIDSVLKQTYHNIELIVVDDNNPSSHARSFTEGVINKYLDRIKYIKHEKNRNGAVARNTGINVANGSFIAFFDDDDIYYPERIEKCVKKLVDEHDCVGVYSSVDIFQNDSFIGTREAVSEGYISKELLLNEGLFGTGSNLFLRKRVVQAVGGFDERFFRYQDVEFMLRVSEKGKIAAIQEVLVRKNIESTNIPSYKKYYENKQLIFSNFSYLIKNLNEEEKKTFYMIHYETLFSSVLASCNWKYIFQSLNNLKKVKGRLSLNFGLKPFFHIYIRLIVGVYDYVYCIGCYNYL